MKREHVLMLLDIDGFKAINDTYGHAVGDRVVMDVAEYLKACFRKADIVSRFGGDEFLVLARGVSQGEWLLDRLERLTAGSIPDCAYTNSVGVALYPRDGRTFGQLFSEADRALYRAKARKQTFEFASGPEK